MENKKAVIIVGISASGKSTLAQEYVGKGYVRVERDIYRHEILMGKDISLAYETNMWSKWNWKWEKDVTTLWENKLQTYINGNLNIVISDTNLNKQRVEELQKRLESEGYEVSVVVKNTPLQECIERDKNRLHTVGEQVIFKQYMQLVENWDARKRYVPNNRNPKAIIVDIDGTLAHMTNRGPFDWYRVGEDLVDEDIRMIVRNYELHDYEIIILSGRDSVCRKQTEEWLLKNNIPCHELFMRKENDCRKDWIIKEELFWEHIAENYNVKLVIDDRKQVVMNTWHPLGLKVLQAGNAYLDF